MLPAHRLADLALLGYQLLPDPDLLRHHQLLLDHEHLFHNGDDQPVAFLAPLLGRADRPVHLHPLDFLPLLDGLVNPDLAQVDRAGADFQPLLDDRDTRLGDAAGLGETFVGQARIGEAGPGELL